MANTTITDLTAGEITNDNDCFVMDTSEGVTVKITYAELVEALTTYYVRQESFNSTMATVFQAINGKQSTLTFDDLPKNNSANVVYSYGIYNAIQSIKSDIASTYATQNMVTGITNSLSQTLGQAINTKQNKVIQSGSITIPASGWSNNENTVTCEHSVTNRNIIDIPTDEFATWGDKSVYAYSETATTITFKCSETPTTDLHCKLTSMEVDTNVS